MMPDFIGVLSHVALVLATIALLGALGVAAGVVVAMRGKGGSDDAE